MNGTLPETVPLANQVAGHPGGVQSLAGGRLVVKSCLERELLFYTEVQRAIETSDLDDRQQYLLERLWRLIPECKGSWKEYSGQINEQTQDGEEGHRIVLENLTFGYHEPNVCDIKLGTQLWDEEASEEKRKRMDLAAQNTTSGTHGIRLTGWQIFDNESKSYHAVPKTFGKTITSEHLELGVRMLLACPEEQDAHHAEAILQGTSRVRVEVSDTKDGVQGSVEKVNGDDSYYLPRLPSEIVEHLLRAHILPTLDELVKIFSELEVRMRGASMLLVYEGKVEQLRQATQTVQSSCKVAQVRLIDFGHARLVPGQGPDEGVLLGLRTVQRLFRQQLDSLTQRTRSNQQTKLDGYQSTALAAQSRVDKN